MYRIMIAKTKKDNYASLYQYLTTTVDGVISPVEFETLEALDEKVEQMLNDGGYSKSDFIIVQQIDYDVLATLYNDDTPTPDPDPDPDPEPAPEIGIAQVQIEKIEYDEPTPHVEYRLSSGQSIEDFNEYMTNGTPVVATVVPNGVLTNNEPYRVWFIRYYPPDTYVSFYDAVDKKTIVIPVE